MKKIIFAITCAVIIVITSFSSVASARSMDKNDLIQQIVDKIENNDWYPGELLSILAGLILALSFKIYWYILTNFRLIIKDGRTKTFYNINLSDIEDFDLCDKTSDTCDFKLKSGDSEVFNNVEIYPNNKYLKFAIEQSNR